MPGGSGGKASGCSRVARDDMSVIGHIRGRRLQAGLPGSASGRTLCRGPGPGSCPERAPHCAGLCTVGARARGGPRRWTRSAECTRCPRSGAAWGRVDTSGWSRPGGRSPRPSGELTRAGRAFRRREQHGGRRRTRGGRGAEREGATLAEAGACAAHSEERGPLETAPTGCARPQPGARSALFSL